VNLSKHKLTTAKGGAPPLELLLALVKKYVDEKGKKFWSCIAPTCDHRQAGNAQLDCALKHATTCQHLEAHDSNLYECAIAASGNTALGAWLTRATSANNSDVLEHLPKKAKVQGNTLDINKLWEAGKRSKAEQLKAYQDKVDHVIMHLICIRGLVPNIIDSPEWKEFLQLLNSQYHPTSASTFANKHILHEAVWVWQQQINILQASDNLTLTFDGNSTWKPNLIYTAHATTPSHQTYFLDGHQGSDEHHTAEWVKEKLLKVCPFNV